MDNLGLIPVFGILMTRTHKLMKTPWHWKKEKGITRSFWLCAAPLIPGFLFGKLPLNSWGKREFFCPFFFVFFPLIVTPSSCQDIPYFKWDPENSLFRIPGKGWSQNSEGPTHCLNQENAKFVRIKRGKWDFKAEWRTGKVSGLSGIFLFKC